MGLSGMEVGGSVEKCTARSCPGYPSKVSIVGDGRVSLRIEWGSGNDALKGDDEEE